MQAEPYLTENISRVMLKLIPKEGKGTQRIIVTILPQFSTLSMKRGL